MKKKKLCKLWAVFHCFANCKCSKQWTYFMVKHNGWADRHSPSLPLVSAISNPPPVPQMQKLHCIRRKKMEFPFYWLDDAELCELMSFTHKSFFLLSFHAKSLVVRGFTAYLSFRRVQGWQLARKRMVVIWDINTCFKWNPISSFLDKDYPFCCPM